MWGEKKGKKRFLSRRDEKEFPFSPPSQPKKRPSSYKRGKDLAPHKQEKKRIISIKKKKGKEEGDFFRSSE